MRTSFQNEKPIQSQILIFLIKMGIILLIFDYFGLFFVSK